MRVVHSCLQKLEGSYLDRGHAYIKMWEMRAKRLRKMKAPTGNARVKLVFGLSLQGKKYMEGEG